MSKELNFKGDFAFPLSLFQPDYDIFVRHESKEEVLTVITAEAKERHRNKRERREK